MPGMNGSIALFLGPIGLILIVLVSYANVAYMEECAIVTVEPVTNTAATKIILVVTVNTFVA